MRRIFAHLSTLANGLCGVGAVLYVLAGNPTWAGLLIVCGVGFDGLDGFLARKAGGPPSAAGRYADSVADAVTFALAPAALLVVHTEAPGRWAPYEGLAWVAAAGLVALAIARLTYFTLRGYQRSDFLGAPTPQTALAIVALVLWTDVPGFAGVHPLVLLPAALLATVVMVVPVPFPKIRRGARLRGPMAVTGAALVFAEIPVQFRPAPGSLPYDLALGALSVASAGLLLYYLAGPFTVRPASAPGAPSAG